MNPCLQEASAFHVCLDLFAFLSRQDANRTRGTIGTTWKSFNGDISMAPVFVIRRPSKFGGIVLQSHSL
jgi:hypothetical protein